LARRVQTVDRNLGDAIRGWGGISAAHIGLLAIGYALLQGLELLLHLWSAVLGRAAGFLFPLGVTLLAALVLSRIERRHGAHHAVAVLRFHLSRRTRCVYAPLARPRRARGRLDPED
jgi:hypothetical protein